MNGINLTLVMCVLYRFYNTLLKMNRETQARGEPTAREGEREEKKKNCATTASDLEQLTSKMI